MKVVIIGGVAAGASCAARLRRLDEKADIVVLEKGAYVSFANCGIPYHIGGTISERASLLLHTPESLKTRFNIDARVLNEVVSIDKDNKRVHVVNLQDNSEYDETYDKLVIATGSTPIKPNIKGIDSSRIHSVWTVPNADEILSDIKLNNAKDAVVVGGGFIGLEMCENLVEAGLNVSLVEASNQVMAPLDIEMAKILHKHLIDKGIDLYLSNGVSEFIDHKDYVEVVLSDGTTISSDLVILSIGIKPNSRLAIDAGIETGMRQGILVDDEMLTSDDDIYAAGDVVVVDNLLTAEPCMVPLAGPANKQGRIVANNIMGGHDIYEGSMGTSIAKIFDLDVACTGLNEKHLQSMGLEHNIDYYSNIIVNKSHAGYYPGATPLYIKYIYSADNECLLGCQVIGKEGVDKQVDVFATCMFMNGCVEDLAELELSYAPPFSSAKAPMNMAGFVANNVLDGLVELSDWDTPDIEDVCILDVREKEELEEFSFDNAINIPLGQLRDRVKEVPEDMPILIFCAVGVRAYNAARILMQNGYTDVRVYPGGVTFWRACH